MRLLNLAFYLIASVFEGTCASIDRRAIVQRYNLTRLYNLSPSVVATTGTVYTSLPNTPILLGTPNIAFPLDPTGLQSLSPFPILSSWAWKNDTLPPNRTIDDILSYRGAKLKDAGGVERQYMFQDGVHEDPVDAAPDLMQWLITNPNRADLGRVGIVLVDSYEDVDEVGTSLREVEEGMVTNSRQTLDLWSGTAQSNFTLEAETVAVRTVVAEGRVTMGSANEIFKPVDTISIEISSALLARNGTRIGIFLDFPWSDGSQKFKAPFVGTYAANTTNLHQTKLTLFEDGKTDLSNSDDPVRAQITHTLVNSTFVASLAGDLIVTRPDPSAHRYIVLPSLENATTFRLSISYHLPLETARRSTPVPDALPKFEKALALSSASLQDYWTSSAFIDMVSSPFATDPRADELQRRVILSRYLMRINAGGGSGGIGDGGPQESGLVNNGWYGKFHMEMYFWHTAHFLLWTPPTPSVSARSSIPSFYDPSALYARFLPTSLIRAQSQQSYPFGARWSKMTDPTGRSAPGMINELLIWQQVHPIVLAELEWRVVSGSDSVGPYTNGEIGVLTKWWPVVFHTAQWMVAYAQSGYNSTSGRFDLGPPMYLVNEDTDPLVTRNPAFELWEWKVGLTLAMRWATRMNRVGGMGPLTVKGVGPEWGGLIQQGADDIVERTVARAISQWSLISQRLSPLPTGPAPEACRDGGSAEDEEQLVYQLYEGISNDFWDSPEFTNDHPSLVGLFGWLPDGDALGIGDDTLDVDIARRTMECSWQKWNMTNMWGWDFGILALAAARHSTTMSNRTTRDTLASFAVSFLLHPLFDFDDAGMPTGGTRVPGPYFPGSGSLLYAVGAMAGGWTSSVPVFPSEGWDVKVEGVGWVL